VGSSRLVALSGPPIVSPPPGTELIENLIDDARRENAFSMLMSLNTLIEFGDAFDYTGADFAGWCREAGFKETEVMPLAGPTSPPASAIPTSRHRVAQGDGVGVGRSL
jgi:hypothetical protein